MLLENLASVEERYDELDRLIQENLNDYQRSLNIQKKRLN